MLQVGGQFLLIHAVVGWSLDLPDGVAGEGQGLGNRQPPAVRSDGVYHVPSLVRDLKHGPLQQRPGRQSGGGVVVGGLLHDLDLPCDGGVLPGHFRSFPRLDIDSALLSVRDISLILQFTQVIAARNSQILKPGIAPVIGGLLVNGVVSAVVEDEGHAGDALAVGGGNFMEQDAGEGRVGHSERRAAPIFYSEIVGRVVQFEALGTLRFHRIIAIILQRNKDAASFPRGHGVHQSVIADPPDLEGGVGDTLGFVSRTDLDDLYTSHGVVVKTEGLRVVGVDGDGLALAVRVDGISRHALQFRCDDGAGYPGQGDLTCGVRIVDALAGQGAAPVIHIAAIRVFDLKLDALQGNGLGPVPAPLFDHQIAQGLIPKFQSDGLARLDLDGLGDIIQQVSGFGPGFLHHQRGAGGDIFHQEGTRAVRHKFTVIVAYHGSV